VCHQMLILLCCKPKKKDGFSKLLAIWNFKINWKLRAALPCRYQFHQHSTRAFYVQKYFVQLFSNYILALEFLAPNFRTKIVHIKRLWNWRQVLVIYASLQSVKNCCRLILNYVDYLSHLMFILWQKWRRKNDKL